MTTHRSERVGDIVREILAETIRRDVRDPRVGFVTLTEVRMSPDLRHATIYVATSPDRSDSDAVLRGLNHAAPFLRRSLARRAGLRFTPRLRFVQDVAIERGSRVDALLDDLRLDHEPDADDRSDRDDG